MSDEWVSKLCAKILHEGRKYEVFVVCKEFEEILCYS